MGMVVLSDTHLYRGTQDILDVLYGCEMKPGDLVVLKNDEELFWDDFMFEWDHPLLFATREDCRDMSTHTGELSSGTMGTVLECDPNYVRILTHTGTGWGRKISWRVIT